MSNGWRALFAGLTEEQQHDVRDILAEDYAAEVRLARQLTEHANRLARHPDRRARLLEIARREEEHARWLREVLERLGGRPPERVPSPPDVRSNWERLVTDLEAEKHALEKLLDDAYAVQRDHPEIAALLLRIRQEEAAHQREIAWVLARSDRMVLDRPSLDAVTRETFSVGGRTYAPWSLHALERHLRVSLARLPVSIRIAARELAPPRGRPGRHRGAGRGARAVEPVRGAGWRDRLPSRPTFGVYSDPSVGVFMKDVALARTRGRAP